MAEQNGADVGVPLEPPGQAILPGGKTVVRPDLVRNEILRAIQAAAEACSAAQDTREMNEAGQAVEHLVNGLTKMTPDLGGEGTPIQQQHQMQAEKHQHEAQMANVNAENQVALETLKHNNAMQLEELRGKNQKAAAQTRTVSVKRDAQGRPSQYTSSG